MKKEVQMVGKDDLAEVVGQLRRNGVQNSWAIQDLTLWPDRSKLFYVLGSDPFSYLLVSGHPASHGHPTLICQGQADLAALLLNEAKLMEPCVIRETPADFLPSIQSHYPDAKIYLEQRMDITPQTFTPRHKGLARALQMADVEALAKFFWAPPQAAGRFKGWLGGAKAFYGVFEGDRLAAIGSSMVSVPEAWNLVSIETHKDFRQKGYGTELSSALVAHALKETNTVTVTVVKENIAAIKTYEKVGFRYAQDRVWVDNGTGSAP